MDEYLYSDSDETVYYIASYTSGGAPYGITWEEYEGENSMEEDISFDKESQEFEDDDLPF